MLTKKIQHVKSNMKLNRCLKGENIEKLDCLRQGQVWRKGGDFSRQPLRG